MRILIDADPIVYASAFAAEEATYFLIVEEEDFPIFFTDGNEMKEWKKENRESEEPKEIIDQIQQIDVGPFSHARRAAFTTIEFIVRECEKRYGKGTPTLILSGKTNFRNEVAQVRGYKANRKNVRKPEHYARLRKWIAHNQDAIIVENREADDELAIIAQQCREDGVPYVICTIDKDLDQIPGEHFDYKKHVFYDVPPNEARELFWEQAISGDSTDNIPGVPGIGAAGARKLVNQWIEEELDDVDIWTRVVGLYEKGQQHKKCEYLDRRPEDVALEMARLVYLQRELGELWTPPGQPKEYVEVGLDD